MSTTPDLQPPARPRPGFDRLMVELAILKLVNHGETAAAHQVTRLLAHQDRLRDHSIAFNTASWRAAVALGEVPEGAEEIPHDATRIERLAAEYERLRERYAAVEWAEILTEQGCAEGRHTEWYADTENLHACPWCEIERQRPELGSLRDNVEQADADRERGT